MRRTLLALVSFAFAAAAQRITHGPMAGDVTDTSAVIWVRGDAPGEMRAVVGQAPGRALKASAETDFTAKIKIDGLKPDTQYRYTIGYEGGPSVTGVLRTAPAPSGRKRITFAYGGDVAGQNVCRDIREGFPIFTSVGQIPLSFFLGLGDMIYADNTCEAVGKYGNAQVPGGFGPSTDLKGYWDHWKYTYGDPAFRKLLARIPYLSIWDDHEVVNDFGPTHDSRSTPPYKPGVQLMPIGLSAFLHYNPVDPQGAPKRLYRTFRWGKHLELIILDTRQYRDPNSQPDGPDKSLLGSEQLAWLKNTIAKSDATWKVIVSSVPISIPTGSEPKQGRDGWANFEHSTGAERELREIFQTLESGGAYNNLWITTDVHFAAAFQYTPLADKPDFKVHEVVTGPLNAGLFPSDRYDTTFRTQRLFFYGPDKNEGLTWAQAKQFMNYGVVKIDEEGGLRVEIRDVAGRLLWQLGLGKEPKKK